MIYIVFEKVIKCKKVYIFIEKLFFHVEKKIFERKNFNMDDVTVFD